MDDLMVERLARYRILIVPGLHDSGPDHWQTRWQRRYPRCERVEQIDWDSPDLAAWSAQIGSMLRRSVRPAIIVAHSFGCLATMHRALAGAPNLRAALLVAPPDPDRFGVAPQLQRAPPALLSTVIASQNDPWMEAARAAWWAAQWQSGFLNAGSIGHINADSGIGDWSAGLDQLAQLAGRIPVEEACGCTTATCGPPARDARAARAQ